MSNYSEQAKSFCRSANDFNYLNVFDRIFETIVDPMIEVIRKEEIQLRAAQSNMVAGERSELYRSVERKIDDAISLHANSSTDIISKADIRGLIFKNLHTVKTLDEEAYNSILKLQKLI